MPRIAEIKSRTGTAAQWASANPILSLGELGLESDTLKVKFGNGLSVWNLLPYITAGGGNPLPPVGERQSWGGWRTAMHNSMNTPVKWMAIGDSITEGTGVTTHAETWLNLAAKKVREAYPTIDGTTIPGNAVVTQHGWTPIAQTSSTMVSPWVGAGSFSSASSFGFRHTKSTSISSSATLTATVTGTDIDVWWTQGPSTVAFTVWVNGVLKATLGTSSASVTSGFKSRITMGAAASYTVQIKGNAAASSSFINGVTVYNGNYSSGLVTINAGVHGYKTTEWNVSTAHANWIQDYGTLDPHLVTIMLGANDYSSVIGPATFQTNLNNMINSIRTNNSNWPTILLMSCYKENFTYTPIWEQYEYSMEKVALDQGCAYVDLRTLLPDPGSAAANAAGYYADAIHLAAPGDEKVATELANILIARAV